MQEGPVAARMREKLMVLEPSRLEFLDDSARHAGHSAHGGVDGAEAGESHFFVTIVSDRFTGRTRLERQRMVTDLLRAELAGPVHALSVKAMAPDEVG